MRVRTAIIVLLLLLLPALVLASEDPGKGVSYFTAGIGFYKAGNYAEALRNLSAAYETAPSVGDYTLLYMAKAHLHTGNTTNALRNVRKLYDMHPSSPLRNEARGIEVMSALQRYEFGALGLLETYVKDFPSDMDMTFLLAGLLKETGRIEASKPLFKEIYISACPLSEDAMAELEPQAISAPDLLERGKNLIKNRQYTQAESDLMDALEKCDPSLRKNVKEQLALSLFKQRKYDKASGLFLETGDLYNAARSFIRAGKQNQFNSTMQKLVEAGDPKGAKLMIAYSDDLRRRGKTNHALKLLKKVTRKYPDMAEGTLWSRGWTLYVSGDYKKARRIFAKLYSKHKSPKYLYWQAKAAEKTDRDADRLFKKLNGDDFYGVLARLRTGDFKQPEAKDTAEPPKLRPIERIDLLVAAGLKEEAANELALKVKADTDYHIRREIAIRLMELQLYRKAILVALTLPPEMQPVEVLYPRAFWPRVESSAEDYDIDPFLLLSLIREESHFDPGAVSSAGAVGLMQLMPQTAKITARTLDLTVNGPASLLDVDLNVRLGTHFLSGLLDRFDSVPAALAAYNAGGSRVNGWIEENNYGSYDEFIEDIPFDETRNYVKRILSTYYRYQSPEFQNVLEIL